MLFFKNKNALFSETQCREYMYSLQCCPAAFSDPGMLTKRPLLCRVYTGTHVARKHVSQTSNLYPESGYIYYVDGHMLPDTSCSFGIHVDCILAT